VIKIDIEKELHGASGAMNLEVNLEIKEGEFLAITGESGAGKSTLLRILAGLESSKGEIEVHGKSWNNLSIQKREIGFVFQEYGLFENMSVEQNLLYVAKDKNLAKELLATTELTNLKNRLPKTLSGGQKQRVALCRAFMKRPKLLLMDEPLSALNPTMRTNLQDEILILHKKFGTTTFMVSHDTSDIYRMASRVIVLELGKVVNNGTPKEVFSTNKSKISGEVLQINGESILLLVGEQLLELNYHADKIPKLGERITINTSL